MRTVTVELRVNLTVRMNDSEEVVKVLDNMDYNFIASNENDADIEDTEILDWEVTGSR